MSGGGANATVILVSQRGPGRAEKGSRQVAFEIPEPQAVLDAPGTSCVYLTPLIKEHIATLESGEVLEVRSDDPASRAGIPAWSRMTGNPLIASVEDDRDTRFFLRKK